MSNASSERYERMTPGYLWALAAPHTWSATLVALIFSFSYSIAHAALPLNGVMALCLAIICFCMQAAANVLNDYFDCRKGTDTLDNSSDDEFDAVLVYHRIRPGSVLAFAIVLLVAAALLGGYVVFVSGLVPLVIGLVGAAVVLLYSFGRTPISHLPIGELVIGFVMGGLIPLACTYVLLGALDWMVLLQSMPIMVGIGLILATNNTCDIEKDSATTRKTLALLLGRARAVSLYRVMACVWVALVVAMTGLFYPAGLPIALLAVVAAYPPLRAVMRNPLNAATRDGSMAQATTLNVILASMYAASMLAGATAVWGLWV